MLAFHCLLASAQPKSKSQEKYGSVGNIHETQNTNSIQDDNKN